MAKPDGDEGGSGSGPEMDREVVGEEVLADETAGQEANKALGNVGNDLNKLIGDLGQMKKGKLPF